MAQNMKRGRNQRRRSHTNVNRALDSNGPDVKIRGTALQIYDKYQALARDAASSGDRIRAESLLQHAEHYFRLLKSLQPQQQQQQQAQQQNAQDPAGEPQPEMKDEGQQKPETAETATPDSGQSDSKSSDSDAADTPEEPEKPKRPRRRRQPRKSASESEDKSAGESEVAAAE